MDALLACLQAELEQVITTHGHVLGVTAKSISIVPFKKYTWFGLTKFTSGVHK